MVRPILGRGLAALLRPAAPPLEVPAETKQASDEWAVASPGDKILELPVARIVANPHQPRTRFEEMAMGELIQSIKIYGVLQPIIVTPAHSGRHQLVAGERRLRAARVAGLTTIPAIVRELGALESLELALIENLQREDLNPIEQGVAYAKLVDEFGLTVAEISLRVGKSPSDVGRMMSLLRLPGSIQASVAVKEISLDAGLALTNIKDPAEQEKLFKQVLAREITGSDIRTVARSHARETGSKVGRPWLGPEYDEIARELKRLLEAKRVKVSKRSLTIVFGDESWSGRLLAALRRGLERGVSGRS